MTNKAPKTKAQSTWRDLLPAHPAAELFPPLSDDELVALGEDIHRNGLQHPIAILIDSSRTEWLLDGINRLDAMARVGLPFELHRREFGWWEVVFHVNGLEDRRAVTRQNIDPYEFVISVNIHRRHLNAEERRDLIVKLLRLYADKSDRQIGDLAKADHKTVGTVRREVEATGEIPQLTKTKGADGKERPRRTKTGAKSTPGQQIIPAAVRKLTHEAEEQQLDNICANANFDVPAAPKTATAAPESTTIVVSKSRAEPSAPDLVTVTQELRDLVNTWLDEFPPVEWPKLFEVLHATLDDLDRTALRAAAAVTVSDHITAAERDDPLGIPPFLQRKL